MSALTSARRSTSARTRGLELPLAFQLSTIAAAELALTKNTKSAKASRRRLQDKALRMASIEVTP